MDVLCLDTQSIVMNRIIQFKTLKLNIISEAANDEDGEFLGKKKKKKD